MANASDTSPNTTMGYWTGVVKYNSNTRMPMRKHSYMHGLSSVQNGMYAPGISPMRTVSHISQRCLQNSLIIGLTDWRYLFLVLLYTIVQRYLFLLLSLPCDLPLTPPPSLTWADGLVQQTVRPFVLKQAIGGVILGVLHWLIIGFVPAVSFKLLNTSHIPRRKPLVLVALPGSLSARSFLFTPACPGQHIHRRRRRWLSTIHKLPIWAFYSTYYFL